MPYSVTIHTASLRGVCKNSPLHLFTIVNGVACSSLMGYLGASLHCINDGVATEPAMGSAAFLNEAINQLAEAYLDKKQKERGEMIPANDRLKELQKVKMYMADRNVYGIDLNPVAVELAEVSLWLNTIYEGGFVPWFGTQLVCGNSLIGARRQVYRVESLQATSKGLRWYENAPDRVPLGTKRMPKKQVYHFLLGDPGMCSYSDKVIKSLEPDNIKAMAKWSKKFTEPYSNDDLVTLLRLSAAIDELWEAQINLRKEVEAKTQDSLSVYGYEDDIVDSHTTIRQKDQILSELYKSEHMKNAGPYARLKFAMDYWCALWFWPIDKADLLPSRSEFLFDMSLILEGTTTAVVVTDVATEKQQTRGQLSLFPTEMQKLELEINTLYEGMGKVDIPALRSQNPRLDIAAQIAEQNHFLHWELEFADLFAEKGGFDLVIGNPPWIKVEWNEQSVLADRHPMFVVKKLTAAQAAYHRGEVMKSARTRKLYFSEYEAMFGQQCFLNAYQNYPDLKGQQTNLFKCFLPQAWEYSNEHGVSAFIHPEGVYDDPKGGALREKLYSRLRKHFMFANERKLFPEVHHHTQFSLNVYGGPQIVSFDTICNLYDARTIVECYDGDNSALLPRIKDENGEWNVVGHPDRIIHVSKKELSVFAKLFDASDDWKQAKLPQLHVRQLVDVLRVFSDQKRTIATESEHIYTAEMWHETNNQIDGTITRNVNFPEGIQSMIYSGPHIGVGNPLFKTSRKICRLNSDFDIIDLTGIGDNYIQRCNYSIACSREEYEKRTPVTSWGSRYDEEYRLCARKMLNQGGERTYMVTIIPPKAEHINGIFGMCMQDGLMSFAANAFSIPYDFYLKSTGKANINYSAASGFPILSDWEHQEDTICRAMLLNCITKYYAELWEKEYTDTFVNQTWSKVDSRLHNEHFGALTSKWTWNIPLRTDYERRQALVEIDVLTSMALGMTLNQLKTIYRIQFPILQQYESDTWYDTMGRIVFTNNRSLVGLGFSRSEFENINAVEPDRRGDKEWNGVMKDAPEGYVFARTVLDDTMPGGPIERTIEYVAPFDRCDREKDYETAWKFFEDKYGKEK